MNDISVVYEIAPVYVSALLWPGVVDSYCPLADTSNNSTVNTRRAQDIHGSVQYLSQYSMALAKKEGGCLSTVRAFWRQLLHRAATALIL